MLAFTVVLLVGAAFLLPSIYEASIDDQAQDNGDGIGDDSIDLGPDDQDLLSEEREVNFRGDDSNTSSDEQDVQTADSIDLEDSLNSPWFMDIDSVSGSVFWDDIVSHVDDPPPEGFPDNIVPLLSGDSVDLSGDGNDAWIFADATNHSSVTIDCFDPEVDRVCIVLRYPSSMDIPSTFNPIGNSLYLFDQGSLEGEYDPEMGRTFFSFDDVVIFSVEGSVGLLHSMKLLIFLEEY